MQNIFVDYIVVIVFAARVHIHTKWCQCILPFLYAPVRIIIKMVYSFKFFLKSRHVNAISFRRTRVMCSSSLIDKIVRYTS